MLRALGAAGNLEVLCLEVVHEDQHVPADDFFDQMRVLYGGALQGLVRLEHRVTGRGLCSCDACRENRRGVRSVASVRIATDVFRATMGYINVARLAMPQLRVLKTDYDAVFRQYTTLTPGDILSAYQFGDDASRSL